MTAVVFFMIDGLRPDAIGPAKMPNLEALRARGSSTLRAQSVMPSVTLPCHMSIFHSVPPTRHGTTTNDFAPQVRPIPGLVERLHASDLRSSFFHNWDPLRNLCQPEKLFSSFYRVVYPQYDPQADQWVADVAAREIAADRPDFAFVYFGGVDVEGHRFGWMSDEQLRQAELADVALGTVLSVLPADTAVILHADHGGHERGHGTDLPEDMTIPWIAAGPGIKSGYEIAGQVTLLDTAPTAAKLLGVKPHSEWEGRAVEEIFQ